MVPAMLAFTAGTLIVSWVHAELFSAGDLADWIWFVGFGSATALLLVMGARLVRLVLPAGRPSLSRAVP